MKSLLAARVVRANWLAAILGFGCLGGMAWPGLAATRTVVNSADSGTGSLRDAIDGAAAGDIIDFSLTGTAPFTITLTSATLEISKDLTIQGPGAATLTVSGNDDKRVHTMSIGTFLTRARPKLRNPWALGTDRHDLPAMHRA